MKVITNILVTFIVLHGYAHSANIKADVLSHVIQLAIDVPELQEYFHLDKDSSRTPLIFKSDMLINRDNIIGVKKFGRRVLFETPQYIKTKNITAYLELKNLQYEAETIRFNLVYPIEGLNIAYVFILKDNKWSIQEFNISEKKKE